MIIEILDETIFDQRDKTKESGKTLYCSGRTLV